MSKFSVAGLGKNITNYINHVPIVLKRAQLF